MSRRRRLAVTGLLAGALAAATALVWRGDDGDGPPPAVTAPAAATAPLEAAALFAAKGCAACHLGPGAEQAYRPGPDLRPLPGVAGRRVPGLGAEAYVRQSIVAPAAFTPPMGDGTVGLTMPRLALTPQEVDALVGYLLAEP